MAKGKKINIIKKVKLLDTTKIYYLCASFVLITLSIFNLAAYSTINKTAYVLGATNTYEGKIIFWENFLQSYPEYKDGWIKLAELYYKNGDYISAQGALNAALDIDPNSEEIRRIKVSLGL